MSYYPFNNNANDESEYGNHGRVSGAALTADRFGNANRAYRFDGIDDVINCGNSSSLQSSSVTVSCWMKPESTGQFPTLISKSSKGVDGYALFMSGSTVALEVSQPGDWQSIGTPIGIGQYYMVTFVYDSAGQAASLYLNGQLAATLSYAMSQPRSKPLKIGHGYDTKGNLGTKGFNGVIDEVRVYNRALSASEISAIYVATK